MGQSGSKNKSLLGRKKKKKKNVDDGCIGNRKVRCITLSSLLIIFFGMGISWFSDFYNWYNDANVFTRLACVAGGYDDCTDAANSWILILCGAAIVIASAICAILLFMVQCGDNIARVAGIGLIVGGLFYIIGWIWYINIYTKLIQLNSNLIPDNVKDNINAQLASWFGEATLPSATAILLGLDIFLHFCDKETFRLFSNLSLIFVVSALCGPTYYLNSDLSDDNSAALNNSNAFPWIATGYAVLFWVTLAYVILYICTCCTCDCKDTMCVRMGLAVGLSAGGVLSAIGYYLYADDLNSYSTNDSYLPYGGEYVAYYVGYTVLITGCCFVWALDIALDDYMRIRK